MEFFEHFLNVSSNIVTTEGKADILRRPRFEDSIEGIAQTLVSPSVRQHEVVVEPNTLFQYLSRYRRAERFEQLTFLSRR